MEQHQSRTSFKNKEQRGTDQAEERAQQLRLGSERAEKVSARKSPGLDKRSGYQGYTRTMLDLLKDPASLGSMGGFRGHQR